jgi:hypothetical protein
MYALCCVQVMVEAFAMKGRGAVIAMEYRPDALSASSIHLLGTDDDDGDDSSSGGGGSSGSSDNSSSSSGGGGSRSRRGGGVQLENLTVFEMGCGYTNTIV